MSAPAALRRAGIALALVAWGAGAAAAAEPAPRWLLEPARSAIAFDYVLDGRAATGSFAEFAGVGALDPARPATAALTLTIAAASIDLGHPLVNALATSAEWFDARSHPEIRYRLTALAPLGEGRFHATGEIEIRGLRRVVESEIALAATPGEATAEGSLALDRTAFGLGVGPSALFVTVDRTVVVRFSLVAATGGAQPEVPR